MWLSGAKRLTAGTGCANVHAYLVPSRNVSSLSGHLLSILE